MAAPKSVFDRAALRNLHVAELEIGTIVWCTSESKFYTLTSYDPTGPIPPVTPTNFPPSDGAPIAGGPNYRWLATPTP